MAPGGPRSRPGPSAAAPRPSATSRNEAFESIFGRPSVAHHMPGGGGGGPPGMGPGPPPGGGYGYAPHPSVRGGGGGGGPGYLHPDQPSYPPGQAYMPSLPPAPRPPVGYPQQQHVYQPPPRTDSAMHHHRNAYDGVVDPYARGTAGPSGSGQHGGPPPFPNPAPQGGPERRASVAPSTYSTTSSASYYSPNPDAMSPHMPRQARMPSGPYPTPSSSGQPSTNGHQAERKMSGRGHPPLPAGGLSAAQAYQASTGYSSVNSPSSVVFPNRAPGHSQSQSPPLDNRSSNGEPRERMASPPPDYIGSMNKLSFDGSGGGPLDNVPGIPRRGEMSDFGSFAPDFSAPSASTLPYRSEGQHQRQPSGSSMTSRATHRRMPSDSSITGSGYTMTSGGQARQYMTPLSQIDAQVPTPDSPGLSPSTPIGVESGFATSAQRRMSSRKSMESTISLPLLNNGYESTIPEDSTASNSYDTRATSFSGSSNARREAMAVVRPGSTGTQMSSKTLPRSGPASLPTPQPSQRSLTTLTRNSSHARALTLQSMPHVYPALLSKVAEAFKQLIALSELIKDGITYKDSFDGRMAVGVIADIIKTPDRNLALLLGRALDAQKFFHDVTYDHRLRDNPNEVYQFKERLAAPYITENGVNDSPASEHAHLNLARHASSSSTTYRSGSRPPNAPYMSDSASGLGSDSFASSTNTPATSATNLSYPASSPRLVDKNRPGQGLLPSIAGEDEADLEDDLPTGVFTLLTDCYSPTCSRDSLCYSINCPRRLEQMKRLNMKPQLGLTRKISHESIHDVKETGTLWSETVPKEIFDSCDDTEKKRQEAINEVIYTERDFVRDLEYLRDSWVKPLRSTEVVPSDRRDDFVRQVFWNVHEVLGVNQPLAERLTKRQKQQPVVQNIGDLFLERVAHFEPFVTYGAHQMFGKYEFEKEKGANLAFQKFVDETERKPESRKLELNGYLTKPTTRLGRYPLLLQAVLKYTPDDSPDKKDLPEVISKIKEYLNKVNIESGKSENIFELAQLDQQLEFRANEKIDLRLRDKNRELVHKGPLKRRGGNREEIADLLGFLFDHALLLVKPKWVNKAEQYRVYRRPIPLELLVVITPEDSYNSGKLSAGRARLMSRPNQAGGKGGALAHVPPKPESKHGFSITVIHLGKKGYQMQLWVDTYVSRKKWLEQIDKQQTILRERSCVFVTDSITEGFFSGLRKINCISPYDNGNRLIYGTDEGVYFSNLRDDKLREPVKVISLADVTQVDVIEDFQLLIVLHERTVTSFPLDCLDPNDPTAALKRGKKIASHTSFFKSGICLGKVLVAVVKSSTLSSTIKVFEAIDQSNRGKKQQASFMRRLNGANEALKLFKEFYIPTESSSIHFLKTKLCVGCTKGFEIVDLETLDMQGLLDPSDASLDFVLKRDNVRPVAIYRIEEDFLLCYDEFAFYVNKNGWRSRPKWAIIWEGMPTAFALHYPYVVAFEPSFIEVHHVESGHLVQIIPSANIQCLFADTPPSRINAPPPQNRQINYGNGHPPPHMRPGGYGQPPNPNYGFRPPGPGPPGHPGMRPPMGGGAYGNMAPPPPPQQPPQSRLTRNQVIFTSDDGHVQFLKFPPPPTNNNLGVGRPAVHGSRSSH